MPSLNDLGLESFWDDSAFAKKEYVDEPLTDILLARVEQELGYKLPQAYVELCRNRNGGAPVLTCHQTAVATSWADDHVAITNIKAIGFKNIWSLCGNLGQKNAIDEWEYPPIGVYFGDCPSAGHDMICLDYRTLNAAGEPTIVHVDQECDYRITPVAPGFLEFLLGLEDEDAFDLDKPRNG